MKKLFNKKNKKEMFKRGLPHPRDHAAHQNIESKTETAFYYGFIPASFPQTTKNDCDRINLFLEKEERGECSDFMSLLEERTAIFREYFEKKWDKEPQAVLFCLSPEKNCGREKEKNGDKIGLEIIGTDKSIAEAIIIKTALELLKENGGNELFININSIGDRESSNRFARGLVNYYKKHLSEIPLSCRQAFKKNIFWPFHCGHESCAAVREEAPKPISFLSEQGRQHFKEVLEYLETLNVPYAIKDNLTGNRIACSQTLFEIREKDSNEIDPPLAFGSRYNSLARKIGYKKEIPAIGARVTLPKGICENRRRKIIKPKVCFAQIGFEAKLKSLTVIEMLRQTKIPVYHALSRDKLASQLAIAESARIPFSIIMGQKEAMENSVIVRNMENGAQETISIEKLAVYLKKIKN